ncbi:MAG: YgeY family selenium metabolism-linked hydrolase [Firmicutes bacterium]|nr:YgeY family selenium metabolism-linked hydrolase [Bacillota bacterium]MCL5039233.1 YgeY family selenium metabolism-linked hydrolase [Bacillota bacterium]
MLRDLVAIPSPSGQEGQVAERLAQEMRSLGFDEVFSDKLGNVAGRIGQGKTVVLYDAHMDTVGVADPSQWGHDPYQGRLADDIFYGLGAGDDKGPLSAMVYGGGLLKALGLSGDFSLYVVGSVGEENCEGLAIGSFLAETGLRPDFVIIGEASQLKLMRGHKGRALIKVTVPGRSAHASAPHLADNPIYKLLPLVEKVARQDGSFPNHPFLGPGTAAVTSIHCPSPSLNTIPGESSFYIDRRLTLGETRQGVLKELAGLLTGSEARAQIVPFADKSYTGIEMVGEEFFPPWVLATDHPLVEKARQAWRLLFGGEPTVTKWDFSTDGTHTMGRAGIPTLGFGPGDPQYAHSPLDQVPMAELVQASQFFALLPLLLAE